MQTAMAGYATDEAAGRDLAIQVGGKIHEPFAVDLQLQAAQVLTQHGSRDGRKGEPKGLIQELDL